MSIFLMKSTSPGSSLHFSYRSQDYFDVTIETPNLRAMKSVFVYDYTSTNGFVEYFQMLAGHAGPWLGEKVWETLEGELKLGATCDAWGHVRYEIALRDSNLDWLVRCSLLFDLGMLSQHASDAENFMMSSPS
ncbi:DUF6228 family protein [Celeribacter ethanolicus]|uniref:DUF6228 family protein n=1 Tax=Celeribacter ethanolicus TaxID=1758178 RepID=UPI000832ED3D|nr:DUF6228 family protein [Celeribacter ethanolicus]